MSRDGPRLRVEERGSIKDRTFRVDSTVKFLSKELG